MRKLAGAKCNLSSSQKLWQYFQKLINGECTLIFVERRDQMLPQKALIAVDTKLEASLFPVCFFEGFG